MEVKSILIDTNAYRKLMDGDEKAQIIVENARKVFFCPVVLGEIYVGFKLGSREKENQRELSKLCRLRRISFFNLTKKTSSIYSKILCDLKRKGKPVPTNDIWIAAAALENKVALFTYDKHFREIKNLKLINPEL